MITNFGELDLVINSKTGRAKPARAGTDRRPDTHRRAPAGPRINDLLEDKGRYRSRLEGRYADYLECLRYAGRITSWWYEPVSFRLPGVKNFYTPDFLVLGEQGLTFVDVKGWNRSDDRSLVKIKTAAWLHPWTRFEQVRWQRRAWVVRRIDCERAQPGAGRSEGSSG